MPKNTKEVRTVRMSDDLWDLVVKEANRLEDRSPSWVVRTAVEEYLGIVPGRKK